MTTLAFRNSQGRMVDLTSLPASRVKSEFGAVLEQAVLGGVVAITRHDKPKAVLLSYPEFEALVAGASPGLGALEARFDDLLANMQTPAARRGMAAAFDAAPAALGRAAVKAAARKR